MARMARRPRRSTKAAAPRTGGGGRKSRAKSGTGNGGNGRRSGAGKPAAEERQGRHEREGRHGASTPARVLAMLLAFVVMVGFATLLSRLTLEPSAAAERFTHNNLHPGDSIRTYLEQPGFQDTVKQLGGNVVLGVPFGLLLPIMAPSMRGLLRVTFATALVMLLVELVQGTVVTGRAFDIDDVLLNTLGALVGYLLLGRRLGRAVHPPRRHWWQRRRKDSAAGTPAEA